MPSTPPREPTRPEATPTGRPGPGRATGRNALRARRRSADTPMTKWNGLKIFVGDAAEVAEHLDALDGDEDAAWEAIDILRDVAVPSKARRDPPYCSAAPAIVHELIDRARSLDADELKAAVLRLSVEILAADHRDLFLGAPDVPAALAALHGSGAGADVAAAVRDRAGEIGAHLTSPHAATRGCMVPARALAFTSAARGAGRRGRGRPPSPELPRRDVARTGRRRGLRVARIPLGLSRRAGAGRLRRRARVPAAPEALPILRREPQRPRGGARAGAR